VSYTTLMLAKDDKFSIPLERRR